MTPELKDDCCSGCPHCRLPRLEVEHLLRRGQEIRLRYLDQEYRLRATKNGKLILTK